MPFIPFAEQTGYISAATTWIVGRCATRSRLLRELGFDFKLAVSLSTRDLLDQELPDKVERLLVLNGMAPESLSLE